MFETVLTPKPQRQTIMDHTQLADLLVAKDKELKNTIKLALEQEEIQKKIDCLKQEVDKQDEEIIKIQKHLKEAEHILVRLFIKCLSLNFIKQIQTYSPQNLILL